MALSSAGEAALLTALLTSRFISLHTALPSDAGNAEVAGGSYARVAGGTFNQSGSNPTTAQNASVLEFPAATGAWGTVSYFGVWSASSGGTFYGAWALNASKTIGIGDVARFLSSTLIATID